MTLALQPAAPAPVSRRVSFALRGLRCVGICVLIAFVLSSWMETSFLRSLAHSLAIGMLCWLAIDLGRMPLARWHHRHAAPGSPQARSLWPGWPLMLPLIVVGTLFGFSVGNTAAGWITGHPGGGFFGGTLLQSLWLVGGALVPGLLITYYFYSREMSAAKEAAIQTAQRQAAEHQLKLLESQLEPHMLFNTLANLRVLIALDPPRAQTMLDQLIAFLRATLAGSRAAQHPLRDEFARLADYLALMQTRMGARLQSTFALPADLAGLPVPPLLLQPLIENCIKHGLEPAIAGGRIDVSAARSEGALVLRVRDTGVGLREPAADGTHFGLVQVRERIAALYGHRASLTLAEADDGEGGAVATLKLPIDLP